MSRYSNSEGFVLTMNEWDSEGFLQLRLHGAWSPCFTLLASHQPLYCSMSVAAFSLNHTEELRKSRKLDVLLSCRFVFFFPIYSSFLPHKDHLFVCFFLLKINECNKYTVALKRLSTQHECVKIFMRALRLDKGSNKQTRQKKYGT